MFTAARDGKTSLFYIFNISTFYWNIIHTEESVQIINAQLGVHGGVEFTLVCGSNLLVVLPWSLSQHKNWEHHNLFHVFITSNCGLEPSPTTSEEPTVHITSISTFSGLTLVLELTIDGGIYTREINHHCKPRLFFPLKRQLLHIYQQTPACHPHKTCE